MRYIGYDELEPGHNFPKLKDALEKAAYPHKDLILHFLMNGTVDCTRVSRVRDVFSNEVIPYEVHVMHAGEFYWSSTLVWYVENYNLRLPVDFERYILCKK